jgi:hypothetical protein
MINLLLAVALSCPAVVTGSVEIYVKAYYLHEDPDNIGFRYTYTTDVLIVTNDTVRITDIQGIPVAFEWYSRPYGVVTKAGFELAKTCGEVPSAGFPLFADGFESGNTDAWSVVIGGAG